MYELSWFRFDGLAAGALLAIWARSSFAGKRDSIRFALLLVAACVVLTIVGAPFGLLRTDAPVAVALRYTQAYFFFGSIFVLIVAFRGTVWTSPLRWRFLQLSGALSYCLYLVHHSVGDGYEYLLKRSGIPLVSYVGPSGAVLVRTVIMLGVSFGIALLSQEIFRATVFVVEGQIHRSRRHKATGATDSGWRCGLGTHLKPNAKWRRFSAQHRLVANIGYCQTPWSLLRADSYAMEA